MSQRDRLYRTRAVVLRRQDYGDADRVLTVYTPHAGKQQFIAKGIRKTTSRKAGHLELFTHAALLVSQARTWDIITEAVTVESFANLRKDLAAIAYASYMGELVDAFSEADDDNQPLWELLLLALREVDAAAGRDDRHTMQTLLRWFELHLLSITGFEPQLFACLGCEQPLEPVVNFISFQAGGILCPRCAPQQPDAEPIEADVLKVLRFIQSRDWDVVRNLAVRPPVMKAVESILYRYLAAILERNLKSTGFLRLLQSLEP